MPDNDQRIRYATKGADGKFKPPFPVSPVELTELTRKMVCREENGTHLRKYTSFYGVGVYGGIATAYSVGCNFRCVFCWVDWSRDWPERYGSFYTPGQVYQRLREVMSGCGYRRARISGAEPTLCPEHLCSVLDLVHREREAFDLFVIETNGVVISQERGFAERLEKYASRDRTRGTVGHVRLSIRGGQPEAFEEKTGCTQDSMELPFIAARRLWDAQVSFHVAVVVDERFTSPDEEERIYERLADIDQSIASSVEREILDPYPHALVRLRAVRREDITGNKISRKEEAVLRKKPPA